MNLVTGVIIIGNEVLSGRTQDANIRFLAQRLAARGLPVREVRIIPDIAETIVATVNDMRARHDHVFTTGGIGPTHDDITSECIAAAFGVPWERQPVVWARMLERLGPERFNAARQRMATMPQGAVLIDDGEMLAPGFSIGNVHVLAGVPTIMRRMFDLLEPRLPQGDPILSETVHGLGLREGELAAGLADIARRYPGLDLGSYPFEGGVALVAKGTDASALEAAAGELRTLFEALGVAAIRGEPSR